MVGKQLCKFLMKVLLAMKFQQIKSFSKIKLPIDMQSNLILDSLATIFMQMIIK
jgi:hypothetical protein